MIGPICSPKHKGTVWANYHWIIDIGKCVASGAVAYTGTYYTSLLERPRTRCRTAGEPT